MIWTWCSIAEGHSWMIWGKEQTNPPSLQEHIWLHRDEGWSSLQNIFRFVQGIIHPSLNQQTLAIQFATEITLIITDLNLKQGLCWAVQADREKGEKNATKPWWQLLSWYSGWTSSTGVDQAWARGTADSWQCWKHSCPNPSQAYSLSQIINKPDNAEGRIDR